MNCLNHGEITAENRCTGCAEPFCFSCLVNIKSKPYCGDCKVMAVESSLLCEAATTPCPVAWQALQNALIGLVIFGIILGPVAISKGFQAKAVIKADPDLTGSGRANAAIIIGFFGLILSILGLAARFKG